MLTYNVLIKMHNLIHKESKILKKNLQCLLIFFSPFEFCQAMTKIFSIPPLILSDTFNTVLSRSRVSRNGI